MPETAYCLPAGATAATAAEIAATVSSGMPFCTAGWVVTGRVLPTIGAAAAAAGAAGAAGAA
ncbi:MAG TPA: hypothetical protein DDW15_05760, partial [Subdoligranulum sp.]|nr:hypothetical protein [Subdoligranulum sp.]